MRASELIERFAPRLAELAGHEDWADDLRAEPTRARLDAYEDFLTEQPTTPEMACVERSLHQLDRAWEAASQGKGFSGRLRHLERVIRRADEDELVPAVGD